MTDQQPRPEEGDETQEFDMQGVFETDRLIQDLISGLEPPDDRIAAVLGHWRNEVLGGPDELGDPAVDIWHEALHRAVERAQNPSAMKIVLIEFIAGVILIAKALGNLVRILLAAALRLLANLPWKDPRPWGG